MSGARFIALMVAAVGVVAVLVGAVYFYQKGRAVPPGAQPNVATEQSEPSKAEPPKPPSEGPAAETAPAKPTAVPSFDVVRIEPTGEGVIAGRAEPGWTVKIESGGAAVAETKADEEGAWSIVLEKPLPAGDNALTLRADLSRWHARAHFAATRDRCRRQAGRRGGCAEGAVHGARACQGRGEPARAKRAANGCRGAKARATG